MGHPVRPTKIKNAITLTDDYSEAIFVPFLKQSNESVKALTEMQ